MVVAGTLSVCLFGCRRIHRLTLVGVVHDIQILIAIFVEIEKSCLCGVTAVCHAASCRFVTEYRNTVAEFLLYEEFVLSAFRIGVACGTYIQIGSSVAVNISNCHAGAPVSGFEACLACHIPEVQTALVEV